ncbi:GTP cyclohydrolase I [Parvularcula bermudensis HTCC2503]|uniref:GTP cyclohydrolase 1 n=1 Tax=Parvularcula bermudensis (strain ATCC BAA-594 / HTCC2503 / KCTC 12087) TaxID=314260 RepID=E0TCM3_PARBH|nr:GTP cyclohydrolase I FolE [Parvularcula bermudensis]ADM08612.1 GTP cyclohydrolase I [Parvularcula bermudensis HTCC2503]
MTKANRPSRADAEEAVRTILSYIGEDPQREGLIDTPKRFIGAYDDWFKGYSEDPEEFLSRTFEEVEGYDDIVLLRNIRVESHCEHHVAPIIGTAHVGYLPSDRVVGLSKIARVVDAYSKRLQSQETLTNQIAGALDRVLQPRGVAVIIDAEHQCISTRGIHKDDISCVTRSFTGDFKADPRMEDRFYRLIGG